MELEDRSRGARAYLVSKSVADLGLSRRRSVSVVNAILEAMVKALARGRDVEFPFGRLSRVRQYFDAHSHTLRGPARYTFEWIPSWAGLKELLGPEGAEAAAGEFMLDGAFLKAYLAEQSARRRTRAAGK